MLRRGPVFFLVVGLCLMVGAGCARTRPHPQSGPSVSESVYPSSSEEASVEPESLPYTAEEPENIRQIHQQIMNEAEMHVAQQEFKPAYLNLTYLLAELDIILNPKTGLSFHPVIVATTGHTQPLTKVSDA